MVDLPYTQAIRGLRPEATSDEEGQSLVRRRQNNDGTGPYVWEQKRGWLSIDLSKNNGVDVSTFLNTQLNSRNGACVEITDGQANLTQQITFNKEGCTLTGPERGWSQTHKIFNNGYSNSGTLLNVTHTGKGFRMEQPNCRLLNIESYYPNQNKTPASTALGQLIACDYFISIPNYAHGTTVANITCHNPYKFLSFEAIGGMIENVKAFPLLRGLTFPRCGAAPHVSNVQFNGVGDYDQTGGLLEAWVVANGIAYLLDGVEGLRLFNCGAQGYANAVYVYDEDGDGFTSVYVDWYGPDFEGCPTLIRVDNLSRTYCALGMGGLTFHGGTMVAEVGGYVLDCADTAVPVTSPAASEFPNRPLIEFHGTKYWSGNAGATRNTWIRSGSYAHVKMFGGNAHNFNNEHLCRMDSANGFYQAVGVTTPAGVTRTSNGGLGQVHDDYYYKQTIVGQTGGFTANGSAFADPLQEWFGDGSDGDLTISSGTTTIGGIRNYRNVTITGTGQLDCSAYHVFISGTLDLTNAPANAIVGLANAGGNASGVTPGSAGAGKTAGTMGASGAGTIGIAGTTGAGAQATAPTNQAPANGGAGGDGGSGGNKNGGSGGGAARTGATVASAYNPRGPSAYILRGATLVAGGAGGAGGASGEGDGTNAAGSGGGGGSGAQWVGLWARYLKRDTTTAGGCIACIGGLGGNGSNAAAGTAGGGGAGGGGGGGAVRIVAGELQGNQKTGAIVCTGGAGGVGGNGSTTGAGGKGGSGGQGGSVLVGELKSNTWTLTTGSAGTAGGAASGATGGASGAGGACTAAL